MTVQLNEIALHAPEKRKLQQILDLMADGNETAARDMARKWCRSNRNRQSRRIEALANFKEFRKSEILAEPKRIGSSHWIIECRRHYDFIRVNTCISEREAIECAMRIQKEEPFTEIRVTEIKGVIWRNF